MLLDSTHLSSNSNCSRSELDQGNCTDNDLLDLEVVPILSSFVETPGSVQQDPERKRSTLVHMKPGDVRTRSIFHIIHLTFLQYITILGHFDLRIHKGIINTHGATLQSSKSWHRFYLPSTHALCPFRCVSEGGPASLEAKIEIRPFHSGIRAIEKLSRSFADIWNPSEVELGEIQRSTKICGSSFVMVNYISTLDF